MLFDEAFIFSMFVVEGGRARARAGEHFHFITVAIQKCAMGRAWVAADREHEHG